MITTKTMAFNQGDYVQDMRSGRCGRVHYVQTNYTRQGYDIILTFDNESNPSRIEDYNLRLIGTNMYYQAGYYQPQYTGCTTSCSPVEDKKEKTMEKIYRAIKDTPWFSAGAILSNKDSSSSYRPVDDIWHNEETPELKKYLNDNGISIGAGLIENTPSWFERVYSVKSIKGMYYVAKDKMKEMLSKGVIDDGSDKTA